MPIELPHDDDWFVESHGFPRPRWSDIHGWLRAYVPHAELDTHWPTIVRRWLGLLRDRLGGEYAVEESGNFHLVSDLPAGVRTDILSFCESTRNRILGILGEFGSPEAHGKHVVLHFSEHDDYYAYVAQFGRDGEQPTSAGVFLSDGYHHIACAGDWNLDEIQRILVHELTHNLLVDLPLPLWLNEALAMAFEQDLTRGSAELLTDELVSRHLDHWNADTIQQFWLGTAFTEVEAQELSYSLSRILLGLIHHDLRPSPVEFRRFVLRSDWTDAGAIAAREHLGQTLGNLAARFLGPGSWEPRPESWMNGGTSPASPDQPQD